MRVTIEDHDRRASQGSATRAAAAQLAVTSNSAGDEISHAFTQDANVASNAARQECVIDP